MNSGLIRSLTVLSSVFSMAGAVGTANAIDFGAAPPSLDYPTGASSELSDAEIRKAALHDQKKNWYLGELTLLNSTDPFPSKTVPSVDPATGKKVDRTLVGPAFKLPVYADGYDYYRYVTVYDIDYRKEQIFELPVHRAECYDKSELWSSYSYSTSYTASVTASASFEGLGLSATFSKSRTFSTGRQIAASGGVVADYTPFALKQDWSGLTYIQLLDSKTGKTSFVKAISKKDSPSWIYKSFPMFMPTWGRAAKYPMPFAAKDAAWTFSVERTIISRCDAIDFGA